MLIRHSHLCFLSFCDKNCAAMNEDLLVRSFQQGLALDNAATAGNGSSDDHDDSSPQTSSSTTAPTSRSTTERSSAYTSTKTPHRKPAPFSGHHFGLNTGVATAMYGTPGLTLPASPYMSSPSFDMMNQHIAASLLPSQLLMGSPFNPSSPATFPSPSFAMAPATYPSSPLHPQPHHLLSPNFSPYYGPSSIYDNTAQSTTDLRAALAAAQLQLLEQQNMQTRARAAELFLQQQQQQQQQQQMFSAYSQMQQPLASLNRTVYLGNVPPTTPIEEVLNHVRQGMIESVRCFPEKSCIFISFLEANAAALFYTEMSLKKCIIGDSEIKVGWGKPSPVPSNIILAVNSAGATRNVYLGALPADINEEDLRQDLEKFGAIERIKIIPDKNIAFAHFLNISSAIKTVATLPNESKWNFRRVYYGKDRCAPRRRDMSQMGGNGGNLLAGTNGQPISSIFGLSEDQSASIVQNLGNRCVYLGNIHPESTIDEICNVIRGGLLHNIRYLQDKHICFVTFADSQAAVSFFQTSSINGLIIHNRRIKVGWGKHSGPLHPSVAIAIASGASRNVYIGNVTEEDDLTEEMLRDAFSEYGEIEMINTFREKNCWFVNFTKVETAIKVVEAAGLVQPGQEPNAPATKSEAIFSKYRVNFGKDRCGNPPRSNPSAANPQYMNQPPFNPVYSIPPASFDEPASIYAQPYFYNQQFMNPMPNAGSYSPAMSNDSDFTPPESEDHSAKQQVANDVDAEDASYTNGVTYSGLGTGAVGLGLE